MSFRSLRFVTCRGRTTFAYGRNRFLQTAALNISTVSAGHLAEESKRTLETGGPDDRAQARSNQDRFSKRAGS
jgi:hypothetical protein